MQKKLSSATIMPFTEPVSHTEPLLKSLNLLKYNDIIQSEIVSSIYQWLHKLIPSCFFFYLFKPISSVHEYSRRQPLNENIFIQSVRTTQHISWLKPGSHLCDKRNTSDINISISTRKKEHVPFFLCLCSCLCRLCYAYRTSVNQALCQKFPISTTRAVHLNQNTIEHNYSLWNNSKFIAKLGVLGAIWRITILIEPFVRLHKISD